MDKKKKKERTKKEKITIEFPSIFISVNSQYGMRRVGRSFMPLTFLTTEAKGYKETVMWEAKRAYKGKVIEGPVKVQIWYYFKDKRRRDISNDKLTADGLENVIYKDDCQIQDLHLYKRFDKKNPRTKIVITIL